MDRLYYSPKEVAAILGISDDSVINLVNRGELPALRISPRLTRITASPRPTATSAEYLSQ